MIEKLKILKARVRRFDFRKPLIFLVPEVGIEPT